MAAVVVAANSTKYNVNGSLRDQYYTISGASGDTLTVGLFTVRKVNVMAGTLITAVASAAGTNPGTSTITFTSSAPMTAESIEVLGN